MISRLSKVEFRKRLEALHKDYVNGDSSVDDDEFDRMVAYYETKFGEKFRKEDIVSDLKFENTPFPMPSANKAKNFVEADKIISFNKRYVGPYVYTDKLDGTSLGYSWNGEVEKLHTSGENGLEGKNVSHLIDALNLPDIRELYEDENVKGVRGELVMTRIDFEKYVEMERQKGTKKKLTAMRSVVNGIVNSKTVDYELVSMCRFCAFSIVGSTLDKISQLEKLISMGFYVPYYELIDEATVEDDFAYVNRRMGYYQEGVSEKQILENRSEYDIDGVIKEPNVVERIITYSNPDYMIAIKIDKYEKIKVIDVEWNLSQYGYYIPKIIFEKTLINEKYMKRSSGWDADRIISWKIGVGAILYVCFAGGVIPHIHDVFEEATEENMIYPPGELGEDYDWNENKVHFIIKDPLSVPNVQKMRMVVFCSTLKIANINEGVIEKLYQHGFNTLKKLFNMTVEDLLNANIPSIKEKNATKYVENIQSRIKNVDMVDLMVATRVFGRSVGESAINKFLTGIKEHGIDIYDMWNYPNDYPPRFIYDILIQIPGLGPITSRKIANNFLNMVIWYENHPEVEMKHPSENQKGGNLEGKTILFTGFTDADMPGSKIKLSTAITNSGGIIKNNVIKNLDFLIMKNTSDTKGKYNQVIENNSKQTKQTTIISLNDFINSFF